MGFRILLQPGLAMLFALRAGLRDAREGGPPFLIALIGSRKHRPALMRQLWQDVKIVFLLAVIFDVIYQSMNDRFNVLEMLITATVLAVIPYMLARNEPGPASDGYSRDQDVTVGGDVKYRITPNFLLNATVNPDFGQVEADPSVLNLGAFETFFPERRPFFVEGSGNFEFGLDCNDGACTGLFYSRRIGRRRRD